MLVAMTYNTGLFLALIVGYFLGDYVYYRLIEKKLAHFKVDLKETEELSCHL